MQPSTDIYQQLGEFIRRRRDEIGLTRDELSDAIRSYGVDDFSAAHLYRLETADKAAQRYLGDPQLINALSMALRISTFQILELTGYIPRTDRGDSRKRRVADRITGLDDADLNVVESVIDALLQNQVDHKKS